MDMSGGGMHLVLLRNLHVKTMSFFYLCKLIACSPSERLRLWNGQLSAEEAEL